MKVLVICGGQSTEHSVSRMSCTSIYERLNKKYEKKLVGIDKDGSWYEINEAITDLTGDNWLEGAKKIDGVIPYLQEFDVVFPVLHGLYGEDGTIQGLFELAGVPYVGCRVIASANCMDKIYTKMVLDHAGIQQVKSCYVKKKYDGTLVLMNKDFSEERNIQSYITNNIGYPCFVKASNSGSRVGCYKVHNESELMPKLKEAAKYDRKIVVEEGIDCIELECAILGNDDPKASLVGEILPAGEFYSFESKYEDAASSTLVPARISEEETDYIRKTAVQAFKAVDGYGLSRVDFFKDKKTGKIYLNEINTLPGFTSISMYPMLWEACGKNKEELIDELIELALENKRSERNG